MKGKSERTSLVNAPETGQETEVRKRRKKQPPYHVILWDDDDHTYGYVIQMLRELFGQTAWRAFQMAREVDKSGKVICLTTTMEHAELKREQIHAYGRDELVASCQGGMSSTIEPAR